MIYVLLTADAILFVVTTGLLIQARNILKECRLLLRIIEQHGGITDVATARAEVMAEQVKEVAGHMQSPHDDEKILTEVREVPDKTARQVLAKLKDMGGSVDVPPAAKQ